MKITRDSRKFERANAWGLIKYKNRSDEQKSQIKNIYDISEGGISFLTYQAMDVGEKTRISIQLPTKKKSIDVDAVVVRCFLKAKKPPIYQAGLQFLDLAEEDRATLCETLFHFLSNKGKAGTSKFVIRLHS